MECERYVLPQLWHPVCYILHKWCSACSGVHISKETEDSLPSRPPLNLTRTSLSTNLLSSLSTDAFFWGAGLLILLGTVIRIYVVRNYEKVKKHPGVTPPARTPSAHLLVQVREDEMRQNCQKPLLLTYVNLYEVQKQRMKTTRAG